MSTSFNHTTRAIAASTPYPLALLTATGLLLFTAWSVWFFTADITRYSTSDAAQLQQQRNAVPLATPRAARVVAVEAALGDRLQKGDVVVRLDTAALELDLEGDDRVAGSLSAQLEALERERELLEKKFAEDDSALRERLALLRQRHELQAGNQQIQADITERYRRLQEKQQGSQLDYLNARRESQQMAMATLEVEADIRTAENRLRQLAGEHQLAVSELQRRREDLQRQLAQVDTQWRQHRLAAGEHRLRAPIAGTLASLADIREGQLLEAGQQVASIRAAGELRVRALFEPARALGHIRPGQRARVALDGFAWARYGQLQARVERVASAVQDGQVLVQLALVGEPPAGLPLLHDLPARVEIATGSKSPFDLLLQRAGDALAGAGGAAAAGGRP